MAATVVATAIVAACKDLIRRMDFFRTNDSLLSRFILSSITVTTPDPPVAGKGQHKTGDIRSERMTCPPHRRYGPSPGDQGLADYLRFAHANSQTDHISVFVAE